MTPTDWSAYRRERLEKVYRAIQPELKLIDALFMEEVEFAEVNQAYQRFRDFLHDLNEIRGCND